MTTKRSDILICKSCGKWIDPARPHLLREEAQRQVEAHKPLIVNSPFLDEYQTSVQEHRDYFCPSCHSVDVYVKQQIAADLHEANEIMECRSCLGANGLPTQWRNRYHFSWAEMITEEADRL